MNNKLLPLLFFLFPSVVLAQTEDKDLTEKFRLILESDLTELFFDIKYLPEGTLEKLIAVNDSAEYSIYSYDIKRGKIKKTRKRPSTRPRVFMSNTNGKYRSSDMITAGNRNLPTRQFLFGLKHNQGTLFLYWHGGVGKHLHWVLIEGLDTNLTSFVTLINSGYIDDLVNEGSIQNIDVKMLNPTFDWDGLKYLRGKTIEDFDIF